MYASKKEHFEIIQILLSAGGNINQQSKVRFSLLFFSSFLIFTDRLGGLP